MDSCSGITCGYKNPEHRFDLFIECKDEKVGRFSTFFAVDLMKRLLSGKNLIKRHFQTIELVKYLYQNRSSSQKSELISLDSKIASDLGWTKRTVVSLRTELKNFGFLDSNRALLNLQIS
jgi:hypothetical protein